MYNVMLMTHFVFQGTITNILEENVLQPLLVSTSAIQLASETVRSILKIDDIVSTKCKSQCNERTLESYPVSSGFSLSFLGDNNLC